MPALYNEWARQVTQLYERRAEAETATARTLSLPIELQVVQIGALLLATIPGEFFASLGLQIRKRLYMAGKSCAWVLGYANGNLGYIPSREAYQTGGYEVETAHRFYGQPCCVAPEAGEAIVENLVAAGAALRAEN